MKITTFLEMVNITFFYTLLKNLIVKLISYENKDKHFVLNNNTTQYKSIIDDIEISADNNIDILDNLLDVNSLNRCYILYFIFKKRGIFYASVDSSEALEAFNSYDEYIYWKNIHGDSNFNLDETLPFDVSIILNDKEYTTNNAQINFISWLYYSGLYDYLMQNQNIKKIILDEINNKQLLTGNLFLRYMLYLDDVDSRIDNDENVENDSSDVENYNENYNENNDENSKNYEDCIDGDCGDGGGDGDNEQELQKHRTYYNIDDIDKSKFLYDLTQTTIHLSSRLYNNISNEVNELFRPHLG